MYTYWSNLRKDQTMDTGTIGFHNQKDVRKKIGVSRDRLIINRIEKTKVEVRNARAETKEKLKKAIKDGLSEDNEKDAELELQKIHDKYIKKIDDLLDEKTKEIMTV